MWARFTEQARYVVFFSQEEARRRGESYVNTEHLLLGLIQENDSVAAYILKDLKVSLELLQQELSCQSSIFKEENLAKQILEFAYDEARILENNYIGTEHLLLGLIRETEGSAGNILRGLGIDLSQIRKQTHLLRDQLT